MPPDVLRRAEIQATLKWLETRDKGVVAAVSRRTRSALVRRFERLNAPVVYPWSPSMDGLEPAHRLHRMAATLLRVRTSGPFAKAWLYLKAAVWPVLACLVAVPLVLRCWRPVRDRYGYSLREQWRDVIEAALKHGVFPTEYFYRRVYSTAARANKALYINEREMIALLSGSDRGADSARIDIPDKLYAVCRKAGLAVPQTIAIFSRGSIDVANGGGGTFIPERDLFLRPQVWQYGDQGEYWRWNHQARAWSYKNEAFTAAALFKHFRELSAARTYILQECVLNHPELARFAHGGLCTFKVATGADVDGAVQVLFASFCFPGADPSGDAPAAIDLVSGIDVATGRLSPAIGEFVGDGEFDNHPGTGAIITGTTIPHWRTIAEFAMRAHSLFDEVPFVGWTIGFSVSGPVLLEASTNWGFFPHVLPSQTPFAELCLRHLMRARREDLAVHVAPPPGDFGSRQAQLLEGPGGAAS